MNDETTTYEYIWVDGASPTKGLRSKTKILSRPEPAADWGFDGSSTYQATGHDSDCVLRPVKTLRDPLRPNGILVLCEVFLPDGVTPHPSNTRAGLRRVLAAGASSTYPWFGIEQEYAILDAQGRPCTPLASTDGNAIEQGPFYCSVGAGACYGRELVERHMQACIDAGIVIAGVNFEVAPGQAEVQIGTADPLTVADHLWLARWLLHRIGENLGFRISLDAKPFGSAFNGSGAHTNFSTEAMRMGPDAAVSPYDPRVRGMDAIIEACEKLGTKTTEHIAVYGHGIEDRLTGIHETCSYKEFRYGVADRGASIRIPRHVATDGYGYLEDRRPNANMDPYEVCARILKTVCDIP